MKPVQPHDGASGIRVHLESRLGLPDRGGTRRLTAPFADDALAQVRAYHRGLPGYHPTRLVALPGLAARLGVEAVMVKDESTRLGLGAFKVLGAGHAVQRLAHERGAAAFVTATDGNHGRAVAWAAAEVGGRAVVYLPGAASAARASAMRDLGAEVRRVAGTYDDAVAAAVAAADAENLVLVQDMAWEGYEEVPGWIMQGYTTLIDEAIEQLDGRYPSHVLLPCGVGSFAAAVIGRLVEKTDGAPPACLLVEPAAAACAMAAFEAGTDEPPLLDGDTHSFMACLSCGRLSPGAWPLLRGWARGVVAIPDDLARRGMLRAALSPDGDPPIESGESGAAGLGLLDHIVGERDEPLSARLGFGADARILVVSTEGATDPDVHRAVVGERLG